MTNTKTRIKLAAKQTKKIASLFHDYQDIESDHDLRKRHLTLMEYEAVSGLANTIQRTGEVKTFMRNVAEYFKRFGFTVTMDSNNINYIIRF